MDVCELVAAADDRAQMAATVATLHAIGRCGCAGCVDRALDRYLSARPDHWIARVRALERLGSLYLVVEDDLRADDFVYHSVTRRLTLIAAEAGGRPRQAERD